MGEKEGKTTELKRGAWKETTAAGGNAPKQMAQGKDTEVVVEDFDCTLCLKLLYKPTTTICGHSFCKSCLSKSLRHRAKCPVSQSERAAVSSRYAQFWRYIGV